MHLEYDIKKLKNLVLATLMLLFLVIVVHILLQSGMSCTDSRGCLRSWCKLENLNEDYRALVKDQTALCNYN